MKIRDDVPPAVLERLDCAAIFNYGHLPVAAAYCRCLGLVELVDRLVPSRMGLRPGLVVQAMVLDTLSGRTPLYRLEHFLAGQDVELLLGEDVPPHDFNDTNLARALDAIFAAGPAKIVTELGIMATKTFCLDTTVPSYDTTSTSVWGDYRDCEAEPPPPGPRITHGHSKDHLPELKQFMTELLCVDRGVPIFGRPLDGNSSDKTSNNQMLSRISSIMARHGLGAGAFVYVADSAMVTEDNLNAVGMNRFISRLPANYGECDKAVERAVAAEAWTDIGTMAETVTGKQRPCATYKAFETTVILHEKTYRAVVVHSSSHDKRRQKKLDKAIAASAKALQADLAKLATTYFCEDDARAAAARAEKLASRLHTVTVTVCPVEVRQRGRPPTNGPSRTNTRYKLSFELTENRAAVDKERHLAGCFVLLTNVPSEGEGAMNAADVLTAYKGQYGVESDFAFLKDPIVVNDTFLKTPSRIDVLCTIQIIALMIWRLMERSMRVHVENTKTTLPGWDRRQTNKPTSFMMTTKMTGIMVARIDGQRHLLCGPETEQTAFLEALGLGPPVFTNPHCQCKPIIPSRQASNR
jgi:transposase